jgi:thioredoxin-like negative regulator of GroEL
MKTVTVYSRTGCHLCAVAINQIESVKSKIAFDLEIKLIDDNPELVSKYEVQSVPTFIFIKDLEKVDSFSGVKSIKDIQSIIEKWS